MPIAELQPQHAAAIVARWRQSYAKNTIHNRTKALRRILRELAPLIAAQNLWQCVPKVGPAKPRQQTIAPEQRIALLRRVPQWMRLFILLCADLAFRFAEARTAPLEAYDRERKTLTLKVKGGDTHTLPVTEELRAIIESIPPGQDTALPMLEILAGKPIRKHAILYEWRKANLAAGLPANLRPHDLRRTAATNLWAITKDARLVQQLLGHKSLHATARYIVDLTPTDLRPLLEALKPITDVKQ
ncbi:MAG: tyrosine-type recombinase/integrase [Candidatus Acidiferrum sp.]